MSSKWMVVSLVVSLVVAALGCGSSKDAGIDARDLIQHDAAVIACTTDADCATPPDLCSVAGSCNLSTNKCEFPSKDCSAFDGECTAGSCDPATGECSAAAANETLMCGEGKVCSSAGPCTANNPDVCLQTGEETHDCTIYTCQNKECIGAPLRETLSCVLDTNGLPCAAESVSGCGTCGGFDAANPICDSTGTASCTCTNYSCSGGTCTGADATCERDCSRVTAGVSCASTLFYNCPACEYDAANPLCDETGSQRCDCTEYKCASDACSPFLPINGCTKACFRNTDNNACGSTTQGCPPGQHRARLCVDATCSGYGNCL